MKKIFTSLLILLIGYVSNAQLRLSTATGTASLGFNAEGGVAEITAYDKITKQLYVINGNANAIVVYDFSDPTTFPLNTVTTITLANSGSINSIACANGLVVVVYENQSNRQANGFAQLITTTGNVLIGTPIEVGAQPDMVTFTPDGKKILVANEGEPNTFYTNDPEGSVSIIDVQDPLNPQSQQVVFSSLNGQIPHLSSQPTTTPSIRIFGMINSMEATVAGFVANNVKTPSSVAQDLEPEYITISNDGSTAWVTCQENNAIVKIDINSASVVTILGLGYKNHNVAGNGIDASRTPGNVNAVNIRTWPFKGMYQPDGIANMNLGGLNYLFTANEGDARAYDGFNEELDMNAAFGSRINSTISAFTSTGIASITATGIRITSTMGNLDGGNAFFQNSLAGANVNVNNNFEELYTYGTRSFSIWNGATGALVWDSGEQLERITLAAYPQNFNADHNGGSGNNTRRRSNTKGPEPEAIVTATFGDSSYAFIGLERIGGVVVFNVTNPNAPYFRQYINTRNFAVAPSSVAAIDLGPEGMTLIKAEDSPDGFSYLVVSNEISGTLRIFKVDFSENIAKTQLKPFVIPGNASESPLQVLSLVGNNFQSPIAFNTAPAFKLSTNSVSGFTSFLTYTFTGNEINTPIYIKYVGNNAFGKTFLTIGDNTGKKATSVELIGIKTLTTTGTPVYTLQLLHASDFEAGLAAMDNAPKFAAIWDKFNGEYANTLRVSGGDNFLPSPFLNAAADGTLRSTFANINNGLLGATNGANYREGIGRGDIQFMNLLDLHASAIGNHEFDAGTGTFAEMIGVAYNDATNPTQVRWAGTRFPYLSCNLDFSADANLSGLYTNEIRPSSSYKIGPTEASITSLSSNQRRKIAPATVVTIGGEVIGIVGVTTQIVEKISSTGAVKVIGTSVDDMPLLATQIQPQVDRLRAMGINKVVLLSHLQQISFEKALAPLLSGVDIIVAAGSHTLMSDADDNLEGDTQADVYPYLSNAVDGGKTLIVCTSSEYSYVGRLVIDFDAEGNVIPSSYVSSISGAWKATNDGMTRANVDLNTAFSGTNRAQLAKGIVEGINAAVSQPNAISLTGVSATLTGVRGVINAQDGNILGKTQVFMEGRREGVRQQETNLGNVTSDANLWYARSLGYNVQVSIKNGGGIRASLGIVSAVGGNFVNLPPLANPSAGKQSGEISQLDIANSLRFNNGLSVITVTAAQLLQTMNHSVAASAPGATPGQFAQIGGMRYSFDLTRPSGSRVRTLAVVDSLGNVIDVIAVNGSVVGDAMRTIGMVTLNFMVTGGDNYPFQSFQNANPTLFNRINLYTIPGASPTFGFNDLGSEQQGFAKYLQAAYPRTSSGYNIADTQPAQDLRSQNLASRSELILPTILMPVSALNGMPNSVISLNNVSISGKRLATDIQVIVPTNVTVNGGLMATLAKEGGLLNLSFLVPTTAGNNLFNVSVVAANLVTVYPYSVNVAGSTFVATVPSYLLTSVTGAQFTPLISVGENVNGYKMVGIPDGSGAFDNLDGTFSYFVNHELSNSVGIPRAHGAKGAFVSKWVIRKSDLKILSGEDLIKNLYLWNGTGYALYNSGNTAPSATINRLCSADLPSATAFYNAESGKGTQERIFMNGEEAGAEGRAFAHILTGANAGSSYELPYLGKFSWENALANPVAQDKTIVVGTDDTTPGQVYVYVGAKSNTGSEIEKAGLTGGKLFGVSVNGIPNESNTVFPATATGFGLYDLGQVQNATGLALNALSTAAGITNFLRPEDGAWDPSNPNDFYFVTTNNITSPSRLYRMRFNDIANPELGGSIEALLDGTEGPKMMDNMTIDKHGRVLIQEDPGNNPYVAKIWEYSIAKDQIRVVAEHDPARFVNGSANFMTEDEESSGIIDAEDILGEGMFLLTDQIHKSLGGELVEEGQLLAFKLPLIRETPSISFIGFNLTVGGLSANLNDYFSTNSNGAISFSLLGNAASLSGNNLVPVSGGVVTVTGMVSSTTGFVAGMSSILVTVVSPVVVVDPVLPSISFNGFNLTVGGLSANLNNYFSTNSNGVVSYSLQGNAASLSGNNLVPVSEGVVTVIGMVSSTTGFVAGMSSILVTVVSPVVVVDPMIPSITFNGFTLYIGELSENLSNYFTTNSDGIISFSVLGTSASLSGNNLVPVSEGSVTVIGVVSGTNNFIEGRDSIIVNVELITNIQGLESTSIAIYPNPNQTGELYLSNEADIEIYDLIGNLVLTESKVTLVNIASFSKGIYVAKINKKAVYKLVKQ